MSIREISYVSRNSFDAMKSTGSTDLENPSQVCFFIFCLLKWLITPNLDIVSLISREQLVFFNIYRMMHKNYINLVKLDKKYAKLFKKLVIFKNLIY